MRFWKVTLAPWRRKIHESAAMEVVPPSSAHTAIHVRVMQTCIHQTANDTPTQPSPQIAAFLAASSRKWQDEEARSNFDQGWSASARPCASPLSPPLVTTALTPPVSPPPLPHNKRAQSRNPKRASPRDKKKGQEQSTNPLFLPSDIRVSSGLTNWLPSFQAIPKTDVRARRRGDQASIGNGAQPLCV